MPCVLQPIPKVFREPSGMIACGLGTCLCSSGDAGYRRQKSPGDGCAEHVGLVVFCVAEGLCEAV